MNNASEFEALRKKANERVAAIKQSLGLHYFDKAWLKSYHNISVQTFMRHISVNV
jgi:hypothetical protein